MSVLKKIAKVLRRAGGIECRKMAEKRLLSQTVIVHRDEREA